MRRQDARNLPPGSTEHYSAYVGPPDQYDFMGATQFRLACSLGLREDHYLLDFGCGSLRAGRLFINYLSQGRYYGIDPNDWLIRSAIRDELGGDHIISLKKPSFSNSSSFDARVFDRKFDFILAQSIFSHCGLDLVETALSSFRDALAADGVAMATFLTPPGASDFNGRGWVYPDCVVYNRLTVLGLAADLGLKAMSIPWFHPRQNWFLFALDAARLPSESDASRHLTGQIVGPFAIANEKPAD